MSFCIPLKESLAQDKSVVGQKALNYAILENQIEMPFSMVITTEVFDEFVKHNQLKTELDWFKNAQSTKEKVESFERIYISFMNAQFPPPVVEALRECYELVSIDTNNLQNLSMKSSNSILAIKRSTTFNDKLNISPTTIFTKETFKQFIETVKKAYIGAFTPSALLNDNPKVAVVVSRVPAFNSVINTECDFTNEYIYAESYLGFPDFGQKVEKNNFKIGLDFLKIQESGIETQRKAVVFNSKENKLGLKELDANKIKNEIPDTLILEAARMTKLIAKTTNTSYVKGEFVVKNNYIACTDFFVDYQRKSLEITKNGINEIDNVKQNLTFDTTNYKNIKVIHDVDIKNLISSIKNFIVKKSEHTNNINIASLISKLNTPVKEDVLDVLDICKDIINSHNEEN